MPKLLIIGYVWPEPTSSAAGSRMMQLIRFFISENYQVTFATTAKKSKNTADLISLGIQEKAIELNSGSFDIFIRELKPNLVVFDRFMMEEQFGWRIDNFCPDAVKILDTEDLHFLRKARQEAFKTNSKEKDHYHSELAKREIAAIYRCDLSLIISEPEMELLYQEFGVPKLILFYLPFMLKHLSENQIRELPNFEARQDFISIGNFLHEPNWNAVLHLKNKIWPDLRKRLSQAKMCIYGAYSSQKVLQLHKPEENFFIEGHAESSKEVLQNARVLLAPLQFGAGLKGKLVEAMETGTPSVTTKIGIEGISTQQNWNGFIAKKDSEFIEKSVELYTSEKTWQEKQKNGFEIYNEKFDLKLHAERFSDKLKALHSDLVSHRRSNFTGAMLQYHLHKSTYYLSRYIEEKNKKPPTT
ncbi:glycosyltransferase [Gramella sp. AN32]|uniref:Glycosyltransferase n=1 Tax=Christiangramia antarctica TaxID=2058158 RepID=A0ABW5WZG6_9FLAO|nr:glycosyltransferase [Gramella sp. AN32]MCM4156862.1 glycosyltransferase [Gramella sp. AN32]